MSLLVASSHGLWHTRKRLHIYRRITTFAYIGIILAFYDKDDDITYTRIHRVLRFYFKNFLRRPVEHARNIIPRSVYTYAKKHSGA